MRYYYRRARPAAGDELALQVLASGRLYGRASRLGGPPAARAYRGRIPGHVWGFEFITQVEPDRFGPGTVVEWSAEAQGATQDIDADGVVWVWIPVIVTRINPRRTP